jgi:hypothetical protein
LSLRTFAILELHLPAPHKRAARTAYDSETAGTSASDRAGRILSSQLQNRILKICAIDPSVKAGKIVSSISDFVVTILAL